MDTKRIVGERISKWRKNANMSQEALAEKAGISLGYLGQIERGEANFTFARLLTITSILKYPLGDLFLNSSDSYDNKSDALECYQLLIEMTPPEQQSAYQMLKIYSESLKKK